MPFFILTILLFFILTRFYLWRPQLPAMCRTQNPDESYAADDYGEHDVDEDDDDGCPSDRRRMHRPATRWPIADASIDRCAADDDDGDDARDDGRHMLLGQRSGREQLRKGDE